MEIALAAGTTDVVAWEEQGNFSMCYLMIGSGASGPVGLDSGVAAFQPIIRLPAIAPS